MPDAGLYCHELTFRRPNGHTVVDTLTVHLPPGRPVLITGPTGSGKSSLLHLLGMMLRPTSGEVWADGEPVSRWTSPHQDGWRQQVGILFQHLHLMQDLSVLENILLPCIPRTDSWEALATRAEALLVRMDLASLKHAAVYTLSGGQQQRVALARALIGQPRYLLLDEPSAFQDDRNTQALLDLCQTVAGHGTCLVVCSHDRRLLEATDVFEKIYLIERAQLRERS